MSNNSWKLKLNKEIKNYLKGYSACHDYYHLKRTLNYALEIAKNVKCDKDVLYAAAFLHDIGYKNHEQDDKRHNIYAIELANKWLTKIGFPKEKIKPVLEAIRLHDNYAWGHDYEPTNHIETKIIQDADRIEALGAVGIARFIYYFGERGYPIHNPKKPKKTNEVWLDHDLVNQLERDGLKKYAHLNFVVSKKIAKKRNEFMIKYYKELKKELQIK